ncbi:MAG: hypothetical protein EOO16_17975 [Chitinophagaceae bacterium]|nr:MAG: hypothetical protein EOO16_17975 [Chitinophagaceae bacterium]
MQTNPPRNADRYGSPVGWGENPNVTRRRNVGVRRLTPTFGAVVLILNRACIPCVVALISLTAPLAFARDWLNLPDERDQYHEAYVHHIMVRTEAEAKELFASLSKMPKARLLSTFKKVAASKSLDPGSSEAGGDLGLIQEGTMVRSFEIAAFSTPPGQMSGPIKTQWGWHLVYVVSAKESPMAKMCAETLQAHLKANPRIPKEVEDLTTAGKPGAPGFEAQVIRALGAAWGPALKDINGNLTFLRAGSVDAAGNTEVLQHTEYSYARLNTQPLACARSQRAQYKVNCAAGTVERQSTEEQELRGGQGLGLTERLPSAESSPSKSEYGGFFRQLRDLACKPAGRTASDKT